MKQLSRQRLHQLKLRKKKPAVYYEQKRKSEKKYRQSETYKKYMREYMRKYRLGKKKQ
jgi:hypothetical protein